MNIKLTKDYFIEGQIIEKGTQLLVEMPHIALTQKEPSKYVDIEVEMYKDFDCFVDHIEIMLSGKTFIYKDGGSEQLDDEKVQELIIELESNPIIPLWIKKNFGNEKVSQFNQVLNRYRDVY